jgi:hypothetical protein
MGLFDKWEEIRAKGKNHYIWNYGVLRWGFFMFIAMTIAQSINLSKTDFTLKRVLIIIVINLILFPIGGYFFGLLTWRSCEKKYNKNKQNSSQ